MAHLSWPVFSLSAHARPAYTAKPLVFLAVNRAAAVLPPRRCGPAPQSERASYSLHVPRQDPSHTSACNARLMALLPGSRQEINCSSSAHHPCAAGKHNPTPSFPPHPLFFPFARYTKLAMELLHPSPQLPVPDRGAVGHSALPCP